MLFSEQACRLLVWSLVGYPVPAGTMSVTPGLVKIEEEFQTSDGQVCFSVTTRRVVN